MRNFRLSGYTTTFNCYEMEYPFQECIQSMLGFCDEVIVVDAGSTDGTIDALHELQDRDHKLKVFVESVDFSHVRWAIHQDGYLKAKARSKCTGDYCWQTDSDEIVGPDQYSKFDYIPEILSNFPLMMLPMIEFWGDLKTVRADFFSWKPRLSKNDPRITHGIPKKWKLFDQFGNPYPRPFDSDSCNYIYRDNEENLTALVPLVGGYGPEVTKDIQSPLYSEFFSKCLELLPFVLHVSWLDLRRKIRHYQKYWQKFHASMYNLDIQDTAAANVMFNKPWSEVTEDDIIKKAAELKNIGPRSFHHKIDYTKRGATASYSGTIPESLRDWALRGSRRPSAKKPAMSPQVVAKPTISAIVPSYNKARYLAESVGSLIQQGFKEMEVLIVNDGSTDETSEVAKYLSKSFSSVPIKLLEKPNGGISDARNYAIERASGSHILALDGDDMVKPGFLEKAYTAIQKEGVNLVTSNVHVFGHETKDWTPNQFDTYYIRYDNSIPTLTLYDKVLWEKTGGYKRAFPIVEDWEFFVNCTRYGLKVKRLEEFLFMYRSSTDGLASIFTDRYKECLSMVMTANQDLYTVDEVLWALQFVGTVPERFVQRFEMQIALHPKEWLLHLWLGIISERTGNLQKALEYFNSCVEITNQKNWLPIYKLGQILQNHGQPTEARTYFHQVRILRADMQDKLAAFFQTQASNQ